MNPKQIAQSQVISDMTEGYEDPALDEEMKSKSKELKSMNKFQRLTLFAEGLIIHGGSKLRAYRHAGFNPENPETGRRNANRFYNQNKNELRSIINNELVTNLLPHVGGAVKATTDIMYNEDSRAIDRLKAAENIVKWAGLGSHEPISNDRKEELNETREDRLARLQRLMDKVGKK